MKILQLISSGGMYGAEAVILNLCSALAELGHTAAIGVFANSAQPNLELYQAALAVGVEAHLVECRGQLDPRAAGRIASLAGKIRADLIHAHGYKADVYALLARSGRPLVSTCHTWYDNDVAARMYGAVDRQVLRRFREVVAVSEEVRLRLIGSGVVAERIHLIRNGIDLRPFAGSNRAGLDGLEHRLRVGLVGRLAVEKGVDLFLTAAAEVLDALPLTRFEVVGDGPDRPALEAQIAALGLGGKVVLVGHRGDMPGFFASLDLLVSSSRREGLPIALLEGMASGLALIATRVGAVPDLVPDLVPDAETQAPTAILVEPEQPRVLAAEMIRLLRDPDLRQSLGAAARAFIANHFSARRMAADYVKVYQRALDSGQENV